MPKKQNDEKESGGSLVGFLIVLIFVLIWLSVFALLIKFDAGNLGTTLRPYLKDVPVLSLILPKVSDDQIQQENNYPYKNLKEAIEAIKQLEEKNKELEAANAELTDKVAELTAENNRLSVYESNLKEFEDRVAKFDQYVVFNTKAPELEQYKTFYETMYPENAEKMYQYVLLMNKVDEIIETQAAILTNENMKPQTAADILETMNADIEYVTKVLLAMKTEKAASIINKMSTLYAAKVMQKMYDLNIDNYNDLYGQLYSDYPEK